MEFLFPDYRLSWFDAGPSSPNKTGALLAILFIVAWWPALRFRLGYWLSLPIGSAVIALLLQTESRGALVAAIVACGSVAVTRFLNLRLSLWRGEKITGHAEKRTPYNRLLRLLAGLCALCILAIYSNHLGVSDRISGMTTGDDESANVRVALYSAGLQMIAAAPQGWGHGQAGNAYGQWYQAVGDSRSYLSLVNSHLTWMSDYGIFFQFGYIAGWCAVLLMLWPLPWTPLCGVSFAVWMVLGICGFFSSVLTLPWLWLLPFLLLMLCLVQRFKLRAWPKMWHCMLAFSCALCGVVGLRVVAASLLGDLPITARPEQVEIGAKPNAVLIVAPDRQIVGDKSGHTIRENLDVLLGATVLRNTEDLLGLDLSEYDALLFSGAVPSVALDGYAGRVVLLNPALDVDDVVIASLADHTLTVVVGSLGDWRRARVWEALANEHPNCGAKKRVRLKNGSCHYLCG